MYKSMTSNLLTHYILLLQFATSIYQLQAAQVTSSNKDRELSQESTSKASPNL